MAKHGKVVKVRQDAGKWARKMLNESLRVYSGYTTHQFRWLGVMEAIAGKEFPMLEDVFGDIANCVCIRLDGVTEIKAAGFPYQLKTQVFAFPLELAEDVIVTDETYKAPIEDRNLTGPEAWWKKPEHNFDVVRLFTSFSEEFMAFRNHEEA